MTGGGLSAFLKRNAVTVTMIPTIILVHVAWLKLQDVGTLVKPDEKKDLPLLDIFHKWSSAKQVDSNIRSFRHQAD